MNKQEVGVKAHIEGYNCSQAIVAAFCEELDLRKEDGMRMASGFGGGMRCGEVCGAVTGALMVLGLKYGQVVAEDQETKMKMYEIASTFQVKFKEKYGTTLCRELLGYPIWTEEGMKEVKAQGLSRSICDKLIEEAILLVEEML